MLRNRVASCDAVVHIAGHAFGSEPRNRPDNAPRRSYTQLEYDIAIELETPVYVFLTGDRFPADPHDPEPRDLRELQQAHRVRLTSSDRLYFPAESPQHLDQQIRSLQLKVERLTDEIQHVGVEGRRMRRSLLAVAAVGVVVLGMVAYFGWQQQVEASSNRRRSGSRAGARTICSRSRSQGSRDPCSGPTGIRRSVPPATSHRKKDTTAEDARQRLENGRRWSSSPWRKF